MAKKMEPTPVDEKAEYYFENGYHCAEAVAAAVLESLGKDAGQAIAHATAFGGGFGRSFDDACGALSGCLIVIGHLFPREKPGESWDKAAELGAAIRQTFIRSFETTHCGTLRDRFGEAQSKKCEVLSGMLAAELMALLQAPVD